MAQTRRVERFSALIRREVSELLMNGIRDQTVQKGLVTITEVEVSGDLQHCKIFVSIFGEGIKQDEVLSGLKAATVFVRGELARRLQMRRAPEVIFQLDRGMQKGRAVLNLLERVEDVRNSHQQKSKGFHE